MTTARRQLKLALDQQASAQVQVDMALEDLGKARETGNEAKVEKAKVEVEKAEEKVEKAEEKVEKAKKEVEKAEEKAIRCAASVHSSPERCRGTSHDSYVPS